MAFNGFTQEFFTFFNDLAQNNDRDWFQENKQRYEDHVAEPMCAFVTAIAPHLEKISPQLVANPKRNGGSMFRIYRDTRFTKDKTPYKTHGALQFRHAAGKDVHAPGYYLSAGPSEIVLGLGIWRPDGPTVGKIRTAIVEKSEAWLAARDNPEFRDTFQLTGEMLKRPPKGFDRDHPLMEDLKRKDFIGMHPLTPQQFFDPQLPEYTAAKFATAKPYVQFLCDALDLPFLTREGMMDLVDIGVNLAHKRFADDMGPVLERARAKGVGRVVVTGVNLESSERAHGLCAQFPGLYATAGVHPHYARDFTDETLTGLKTLCGSSSVVAVGECGLDFNRNFSSPEDQRRACEAQLDLAVELGMPVFLHQRDAHDALMDLVRARRADLAGAVVHCFTGSERELEDCLALDLHIAITGWICDERRGHHLQELVGRIPQDRLMIETDAPFLLPRSIRPKPKSSRNEPMYLEHVLTAVAEARGQTPEEVARFTTATAESFFGLNRTPNKKR